MKKLILSAVFLLCLGGSVVYGQEKTGLQEMSALSITVTESWSGEPVQMATVYIVPAGDTLVTSFAFTDKRGSALLKDFSAGKYVVNIQMLGFKPYAEEIVFEPKTVKRLAVKLEEDFEKLKGATITEMGDLVTMKGDTLIYNAASFRTASNASLGDLLKKMPGIEVDKGRVTVNGEPVSRITVEGRTFFFDDQSKALENLPAFIVNQIRVIDKESQDRTGRRGRRKEMDVRLKEEYREAWFGRASAEGGASVKDKSSDMFGDGTKGLYNAKLYAQFYGENDTFTLLGGGNNVNPNQLSSSASGMTDVASGGANYNTSRISGYMTDASATYDFRNNTGRSESRRTSFLSSGEQLETNRSSTNNGISHSGKANFRISPPMFGSPMTEGISVSGSFLYGRKKSSGESASSTINSTGKELNGSESQTAGTSDDFSAIVNLDGKYFLDREARHRISFRGNIGYDGVRGNSRESSVTRVNAASVGRGLLYTDKTDGMRLNAYVNYNTRLSKSWEIYSDVSADFNSSRDNRDAENAEDSSRNDYYSRYATERRVNLMQTVSAKYWIELGENKRFNADFGLSVYEDNMAQFSRAFGTEESSNDRWQLNAGPQFGIGLLGGSWSYTLFTRGKSVAPPQGEATSTVPDFSNPVDISIGNIYLRSGYHQDVRLAVSRGLRRPGSSFLSIWLDGAIDLNEVTRASWYDDSAVRYSIPVNAGSPRYNAVVNITYIQPLNKKRNLSLTMTPKAVFSTGTIYVSDGPLNGMNMEEFDYADMMSWLYGDSDGSEFYSGRSGFMENRTQNLNWSVNADLKYELKDWSLRGGAAVNNNRIGYSAYPDSKVNNWRYNAYAEALWKNSRGWEIEGRFDFNGYSGFSQGYNRPDWLLNLKVAKAIKAFTVSLSAYDILGNSRSFSHVSSAEYVEDTYRNNLGRCILVGISYNFGKWSFLKQSKMEMMEKESSL